MSNLLIILSGESFRGNGKYADIDIILRQKIASFSHLRFAKNIKEKYNINTTFFINTYKSNDYKSFLINKWYKNNLIKINFLDKLNNEFELIDNTINSLRNIDVNQYDNILFLRIDFYLKQYFIENFSINTNKVYYIHIDTNHCLDGNRLYPYVCHNIVLLPRCYYNLIFEKIVWNYHNSLNYTISRIGVENVSLFVNTSHYSTTEHDWNPLYTNVDRNETNNYISKGKYYNLYENRYFDKENDNLYDDIFLKENISEKVKMIKMNKSNEFEQFENKSLLIVLTGKCFDDSVFTESDIIKRQKIATISHMKFIKTIKEKYNIDTNFYINTYTSSNYKDILIKKWYNNNCIGLDFIDEPYDEFKLIDSTVNHLINNKEYLNNYDNILFLRIDYYLKPYFIDNFNLSAYKIFFAHIDSNSGFNDSNRLYPYVNYHIVLVPQYYYNLIFEKIVWNYLDSLNYTVSRIGIENVSLFVNTSHYGITERDWNPLYTNIDSIETTNYISKGKYYNLYENRYYDKEDDNLYDDIFLKNSIDEQINMINKGEYNDMILLNYLNEKSIKKIGIFGSCQLSLASKHFFTDEILTNNNLKIEFAVSFFDFDKKYNGYKGIELDYYIFNNIDILIIENNNFDNEISSEKIINYCLNFDIKIIKTCLLKMPIFPLNWSGNGDNIKDYENWVGLDNIDYISKFNNCINSLENNIKNSDLSINIINYIKENFSNKLLFLHSLHPTNDLLYQLYKYIFKNLDINIDNYIYNFDTEILVGWVNPYTIKMVKDLNINYNVEISNNFYNNKYLNYLEKHNFMKRITDKHPLLNLKFIENKIIEGRSLCPLEYIGGLENYFYKQNIYVSYNGSTIHDLGENTIYFILSHQFSNHFHHDMFELLQILQIYILYCNNVILNNKYNFKIICKNNDFSSGISYEIINLFDLRKDILILNDTDFYKGNFVYLCFSLSNVGQNELRIAKEDMTIFKRMIEISNQKYNGYPIYTKLWISRNNFNIATYWHKRFMTNISEINVFIKSKGFHEINFGEIDIYYQIYLMNNVTTVFSEIGTSMNNMFFMKDNAYWITNIDPNNLLNSDISQYIGKLNNINFHLYQHLSIDTQCKYYNTTNSFNQPYKLNSVEHFKQWFSDWGF